jgi:hypothetical protein
MIMGKKRNPSALTKRKHPRAQDASNSDRPAQNDPNKTPAVPNSAMPTNINASKCVQMATQKTQKRPQKPPKASQNPQNTWTTPRMGYNIFFPPSPTREARCRIARLPRARCALERCDPRALHVLPCRSQHPAVAPALARVAFHQISGAQGDLLLVVCLLFVGCWLFVG